MSEKTVLIAGATGLVGAAGRAGGGTGRERGLRGTARAGQRIWTA